jgi:hypothetical protein
LDRDPQGVIVAIEQALEQYTEIYLKAKRGNTQMAEALERWGHKVVELTQKNLRACQTSSNYDVTENEQMKATVKHFREYAISVPRKITENHG